MSDIQEALETPTELWYDPRRGDYSDAAGDGYFYQQDEATIKMYTDHAESLDLYRKSGGTV